MEPSIQSEKKNFMGIDEDEDAPPIEYWKRIDGNFVKDRTLNANIQRVNHTYGDDRGIDVDPDREIFVFNVESDPLYVNDEWIHTVHPHNTDEDVISSFIFHSPLNNAIPVVSSTGSKPAKRDKQCSAC